MNAVHGVHGNFWTRFPFWGDAYLYAFLGWKYFLYLYAGQTCRSGFAGRRHEVTVTHTAQVTCRLTTVHGTVPVPYCTCFLLDVKRQISFLGFRIGPSTKTPTTSTKTTASSLLEQTAISSQAPFCFLHFRFFQLP